MGHLLWCSLFLPPSRLRVLLFRLLPNWLPASGQSRNGSRQLPQQIKSCTLQWATKAPAAARGNAFHISGLFSSPPPMSFVESQGIISVMRTHWAIADSLPLFSFQSMHMYLAQSLYGHLMNLAGKAQTTLWTNIFSNTLHTISEYTLLVSIAKGQMLPERDL